LKIDQEFVKNAHRNEQDQTILQAIIMVGHGFGLKVVAEGVETADHFNLIKSLGCDMAQGNYYTPALRADEFVSRYLKDLD
jgi:EAL domain-containing protein (putative c-di-GMP-specific phosphodiesterase class I)